MASPPNTERAVARSARIEAMNGPFPGWLRWYLASATMPGIGSWTNDRHPILGEGVFKFAGKDALTVHELGIAFAEDGVAIAFADITGYEALSLRDLMEASKEPWANVELNLKTRTEETVLKLPLVHRNMLVSLLSEVDRRTRRREQPRSTS